MPQSWHGYAYCLSNPLKYVDPTGLEWRRHDSTGGIKWYGDGDDRTDTTEWTQLTYDIGDGLQVRLNPKGPGSIVTFHTDRENLAYAAPFGVFGLYLNTTFNEPYVRDGMTIERTPEAEREYQWKRSGMVQEAPEDIIALTGVGQGLFGLGRAVASGGGTTLFRGVPSSHEFFEDALKGTARPFGGHADPVLHNVMDTHSIFTSWSTEKSIASQFAGDGGVVLQKSFTRSQLERAGEIELPPVRRKIRGQCPSERKKPETFLIDSSPLESPLAELGPIQIEQVRRTGDEPFFNSLLESGIAA